MKKLRKILGNEETDSGMPTRRNRRHWWVVSYDSPDDARRRKIMQTLSGYGQRVQYSVFECDIRPQDMARLQGRLRELMNSDEDDIRLYPLCETCRQKMVMLGIAKAHRVPSFQVV